MSRCIRDSHLAITPQALQGAPSYADNARRVATGANTSPTPDQPSRRGDSRLVNNPTAAVPVTASTTRSRTSSVRERGDIDTAPKARPRGGQVSRKALAYWYLWSLIVALHCSLLLLQTRL